MSYAEDEGIDIGAPDNINVLLYLESLSDKDLMNEIDEIKNKNKEIELEDIISGIRDFYTKREYITTKQRNVIVQWLYLHNGEIMDYPEF